MSDLGKGTSGAIDVTSACRSVMQTGIQRVVRGLHRHLEPQGLVPVVWDDTRSIYRKLMPLERRCLRFPFSKGPHRSRRLLHFWAVCLGGRRKLRVDGVPFIFVPEVYADRRGSFWKQTELPGVAIVHDLITWKHPEWTPARRRAGFEIYLQSLAGMRHLICVSEATRDDLVAYLRGLGGELPETSVLGWPVDDAFTFDHRHWPQPVRPPEILCVGRMEPRKNHLLLLEAADLLWDEGFHFKLVLAGRRMRGEDEAVFQRIKVLQGRGHPIEWYPDPDDEGLVRLYQRARFTVFPSRVEGFGLPVLESIAAGRPCLCSGEGAVGEVARGGGCVTTDVSMVGELAATMRSLLEDGEVYRRAVRQTLDRKISRWPDYILALQPILNPERLRGFSS